MFQVLKSKMFWVVKIDSPTQPEKKNNLLDLASIYLSR